MLQGTKNTASLKRLVELCRPTLIADLLPLPWRMVVAIRSFFRPPSVTPLDGSLRTTPGRGLRETDRNILQETLRQIETERTEEVPTTIEWQGVTFRHGRMIAKTIATRFAQITLRRHAPTKPNRRGGNRARSGD